jgi:hypothetical protein
MATNVELRRSNGTNYNEVIHIATEVSLVSGLLGNDGKFKSELLPSYILGGMRYGGTVDLSSDPNLRDVLASKIHNDNKDEAKGLYFIVSKGGVVTTDTGSGVEPITHGYVILSPGDEGEYLSPVTLETGDWLVYEGYELVTDNYVFRFNVVNNTYRNASTDSHGIVKLATEQDGINGTSGILAMTPKSTVAAINARAYQHPTHTAKNETFSAVETLSALSVDSLGHVTSFAKQAIRVASESQTGVIQLASSSEAKAATVDTKAISPLRAKEMIDKFALIPIVQSLPTDMSDHPAGKLILLQI